MTTRSTSRWKLQQTARGDWRCWEALYKLTGVQISSYDHMNKNICSSQNCTRRLVLGIPSCTAELLVAVGFGYQMRHEDVCSLGSITSINCHHTDQMSHQFHIFETFSYLHKGANSMNRVCQNVTGFSAYVLTWLALQLANMIDRSNWSDIVFN